jgi:hypothetical protein
MAEWDTVGRLMDRLSNYPPDAKLRFADGPAGNAALLSVYSDKNGVVWVDVGEPEGLEGSDG